MRMIVALRRQLDISVPDACFHDTLPWLIFEQRFVHAGGSDHATASRHITRLKVRYHQRSRSHLANDRTTTIPADRTPGSAGPPGSRSLNQRIVELRTRARGKVSQLVGLHRPTDRGMEQGVSSGACVVTATLDIRQAKSSERLAFPVPVFLFRVDNRLGLLLGCFKAAFCRWPSGPAFASGFYHDLYPSVSDNRRRQVSGFNAFYRRRTVWSVY